MKKIIIESHIPFVPDELSEVADVIRLQPENFTPENIAGADALMVRTRTRCDSSLLEGSGVRCVATATIGTDHIDIPWCAANGIETISAPGCNAPAVAQYVWGSVLALRDNPEGLIVGIVGLGNVGSIVADRARQLGVDILACDPLRADADGGWNHINPRMKGNEPFVSLEEIAEKADVITFHTPHTLAPAPYPTHHIASDSFFNQLKRNPIVINAARGPVVDTAAFIRAIESGTVSAAVVDCWEGEPDINRRLLELATFATPHIAGYSIEGKQRATAMALQGILDSAAMGWSDNERLKITQLKKHLALPPLNPDIRFNANLLRASYSPLADTKALRSDFTPARFETLRNRYPLRHEPGLTH